jgi:hypothetical protein
VIPGGLVTPKDYLFMVRCRMLHERAFASGNAGGSKWGEADYYSEVQST